MAVGVRIESDELIVDVSGHPRWMCLSRGLRIPLADIESARLAPWSEVRPQLGWRVGGTYVPKLVASGWYTIKGRRRCRQFLAVFRDRDRLLVVETKRDRPARLVLATPDAAALAERINRHGR